MAKNLEEPLFLSLFRLVAPEKRERRKEEGVLRLAVVATRYRTARASRAG
jgi:hypothetical protein